MTEKEKVIAKIKTLTVDEKFKIVEATKIYPEFGREDGINIDDLWNDEVSNKLSLRSLGYILASN